LQETYHALENNNIKNSELDQERTQIMP
jgi:hypothetical protein